MIGHLRLTDLMLMLAFVGTIGVCTLIAHYYNALRRRRVRIYREVVGGERFKRH